MLLFIPNYNQLLIFLPNYNLYMIKDNSYYKLKYLKYKSKYINYKNLIGGTQGPALTEQQLQEQQIQKLLTGTDNQKENAIKLYIIISREFNKFLVNFESIFQNDLFNIEQLFDTNGTMTLFLKNKLKELFKKSYVTEFVIDRLTENSKLYKDHTELFKKIVDKICTKLHRLQIVSTDKCDDETRKEIVSNFFNSRDLFEKLVLKIVDEKIKETDADKNGEMLEAFILCIVKSEDIDLETKKDIVGLIFSILQPHHSKYDDMIKCNPQLRKATAALFYPTECYKLKIAHKLFEKVSALKDEIITNQENVKKLLQKEKLEEQLQPLQKQIQPLQEQIQPLQERVSRLSKQLPIDAPTLQLLQKEKERLKAKQQKEAEIKQQQEELRQRQQEEPRHQDEGLRQIQQERINNLLKQAGTLLKEED